MSLFHVIINPVTSIRYTKSAYNRFTFATVMRTKHTTLSESKIFNAQTNSNKGAYISTLVSGVLHIT